VISISKTQFASRFLKNDYPQFSVDLQHKRN